MRCGCPGLARVPALAWALDVVLAVALAPDGPVSLSPALALPRRLSAGVSLGPPGLRRMSPVLALALPWPPASWTFWWEATVNKTVLLAPLAPAEIMIY